jgi:deoxyribodipyrimidine photo-lyase
MSTAIWWIRRDLRLNDNPALLAAQKLATHVVPVFILDDKLLKSAYNSSRREAFLKGGLRKLDEDLRTRGGRLILRRDQPLAALTQLISETGASAIFAEEDHSPYARKRDEQILVELPLHLTDGVTVQPPGTVMKNDGIPYTVFTPFNRAWKAAPWPGGPLPTPERILTPHGINGIDFDSWITVSQAIDFLPGETEALRRLAVFVQEKIDEYGDQRNRMDLNGTSELSPYLRFGMISARQAVSAARAAAHAAQSTDGHRLVESWENELVWREFFMHILYHFPHVRRTAYRSDMANILWENDENAFLAWQTGRTGYPVVDAGMRQLLEMGWMHNRARMITASFLVKDLLIDWRWGERHFMQHLLDGDPAANNGGWQWTAGTGTDAAPYFRVFNPTLQGKKFDPHGVYVRRYVSELADVSNEFIHEPWKMPEDVQRRMGCVVGVDYPAPVVDHAAARLSALERYGQRKE